MWELDMHNNMLVYIYTLQWPLGFFFCLCFHFEILEAAFLCAYFFACQGNGKHDVTTDYVYAARAETVVHHY